jgi:sulfur carrier protein ThiS
MPVFNPAGRPHISIQVVVKLLYDLKPYAPTGRMPFTVRMQENATLRTLLDKLGISPGSELVALLDGSPSGPTAKLHENCKVTIFPVVLGG